MRQLGEYLLRGRLQAIAVTGSLTLVSFLMPFLTWLMSGLPPALVTLRKGPVAGIQVILGSMLVVALFALLVQMHPQIAIALGIGVWLPVWWCCCVLRQTQSQALAIVTAGLCGLTYILVMHATLGDVAGWWQGWLETWLDQAVPAAQAEKFREVLPSVVPYINAMMAVGLVTSLIITVLLARWWQSRLFNPGGFRQEFHNLLLPRVLLLPVAIILAMLATGYAKPGSLAVDGLILLVFIYLYQGLAMLHRTVSAKNLSSTWLTVMYVMLLVFPQAVLFMACLGMVDSWLQKPQLSPPNDNP